MRPAAILAALVVGSMAAQLALLLPNAHLRARSDEFHYLRASRQILNGEGLVKGTRPPVYPYAIALAQRLAPRGTQPRLAVGLMQIAASAVTLLLLYGLAAELFGVRAALATAGLYGFYPTFLAHTHLIWAEMLSLCPIFAGLLLAVRAWRRDRPGLALGAGAALGVGALTREYVFWFVPLLAFWLALAGGPSRRRAAAGALAVLGALLVILPWTARNYRVYDSFVLISTNTWTPLFQSLGISRRANFNWRQEWSGREIERERYAREHYFEAFRHDPGYFVKRALRGALPGLLREQTPVMRYLHRGWYGNPARVDDWRFRTAEWISRLAYLGFLVVAACGLVATRWTPPRVLLLLFLVYSLTVVLPFPTVARYRIPGVAAAMPFAAAWLARDPAAVGRLRGRRLAAALLLALALLCLALLKRLRQALDWLA